MSFLRRLIDAVRRRGRWIYHALDRPLMTRAARSEFWSSIYYAVWNASFRREHRGVLTGKNEFLAGHGRSGASSALLRRNTHRLEKGILSRPRRDVFALDYISETVDNFEKAACAVDSGTASVSEELEWASDVLDAYFSLTDSSNEIIRRNRVRFEACPPLVTRSQPVRSVARIPYERELNGSTHITYETLLELSRKRRSVRWFENRPVPRDLLKKAILVARESPSACNRQPFQFRIFDDPDLVKAVSALPAGTAGFNHNFPCVIVVVGQLRNYFDERDRHLIYIDGSLATMALVLALEALGLSSCCINWPDIPEREEAAKRVLKLQPDERPVMFLAAGFPDKSGLVAYSEKKSVDELSSFNFE